MYCPRNLTALFESWTRKSQHFRSERLKGGSVSRHFVSRKSERSQEDEKKRLFSRSFSCVCVSEGERGGGEKEAQKEEDEKKRLFFSVFFVRACVSEGERGGEKEAKIREGEKERKRKLDFFPSVAWGNSGKSCHVATRNLGKKGSEKKLDLFRHVARSVEKFGKERK